MIFFTFKTKMDITLYRDFCTPYDEYLYQMGCNPKIDEMKSVRFLLVFEMKERLCKLIAYDEKRNMDGNSDFLYYIAKEEHPELFSIPWDELFMGKEKIMIDCGPVIVVRNKEVITIFGTALSGILEAYIDIDIINLLSGLNTSLTIDSYVVPKTYHDPFDNVQNFKKKMLAFVNDDEPKIFLGKKCKRFKLICTVVDHNIFAHHTIRDPISELKICYNWLSNIKDKKFQLVINPFDFMDIVNEISEKKDITINYFINKILEQEEILLPIKKLALMRSYIELKRKLLKKRDKNKK